MIDTEFRTNALQIAVQVIVFLLGTILVMGTWLVNDGFVQSLLMGLGSSLMGVPILFAIFAVFLGKKQGISRPEMPLNESRTRIYAEMLRSDQPTWSISRKSKLGQ